MAYEDPKEREQRDRASRASRPPIGGIALSQSNAPVGTTTATSIGRDLSLSGPGSRRQIGNHSAQKAERLAKRYIRKFGAAGRDAASTLLSGAAGSRMGDPSIATQAGQAMQNRVRAGEEEELDLSRREQEQKRRRRSNMLNPNFDPFNPQQ